MRIKVLDHGYVEFVEAWGTGHEGRSYIFPSHIDWEVGIIEAARQSTQGSVRGREPAACDCDHAEREARMHKESNEAYNLFASNNLPTVAHRPNCASVLRPGDARLLSYLYRNNHSTPFEVAGMVIEVQAPIFVFREWHRHRTQSYNEASARYSPLEPLYYLPSRERIMQSSSSNKQAGVAPNAKPIEDPGVASIWQGSIEKAYQTAELTYQALLRAGVPKEVARCVMPVGHYSKMRASANLRNWLAFMTLRCDPAAQWEIQQYALAVAEIIKDKFPQTYALWEER